jgi:hypothetical protein
MSLKAFHIVFVVAATLLAIVCGVWGLVTFFQGGLWLHLVFGLGSLAAAVGLVYYGRYVLKKLRKMSYL